MPHDHAIQCVHDPLLVVLSYLVSVLGSFTALQLAVGIPRASGAGRRWPAIFCAGAAMGGGAIWAMHFIAMLACRMDLQVAYDLRITAASAGIAMASCMVGLGVASAGVFGWGKLLAGGLFMGLGVTGMHYTGMAAMLMPATVHYDAALVAASMAIAVVASIAALWLAFNLRGRLQMLGSALVMGVAVCGMHYTGMLAASFVAAPARAVPAGLSGAHLGTGIFAVTSLLLAVVLATSLVRQRQRAAVEI
ncbi:MAG TPA: MHYT domain-containing protein [Lysobacter sp.]